MYQMKNILDKRFQKNPILKNQNRIKKHKYVVEEHREI